MITSQVRRNRNLPTGAVAALLLTLLCHIPFAPATDGPVSLPALRFMLDKLQRDCLAYIWEYGNPATGMAYEASFSYEKEGMPLAVAAPALGWRRLWSGSNAAGSEETTLPPGSCG